MNFSHFFSQFSFHPVIHLPPHVEVFDFTQSYDPNRMRSAEFGIGIYNEKRVGMYTTELFTRDPSQIRDIHVGIDLAAPAGTAVHAFSNGKVFCAAINPSVGDYGGTLITEHQLKDLTIWALHGHLSHASVQLRKTGDTFEKGAILAYLGEQSENGGWNPHLHFQISLEKPIVCDMPGAVSDENLDRALKIYLDPRLILGPIY